MQAALPSESSDHVKTKKSPCVCPSCGSEASFTYVGEQRWPDAVAKRRGVSSVMLWTCSKCGTSVDGLKLTGG